MILVGNQRGGARDLARHLMKEENERVVVHEVRGFASDTLHDALQESYAISRGTRCKQHLYSLSLNPPKEVEVAPETFEDAVNRAEESLGLQGQPRAIVFHEKRGTDGEIRRHAHAVWCRIDSEQMKAVQISYDRKRLQALGRELYLEHGWKMPRGFVCAQETNPRNYSLAEWQQAKRAKKDPAKLKGMMQECWAISDCQISFTNALKENGYILARGDRRGVVAVDRQGEAFAVARAVGLRTKQIRERISDAESLPDVATAHHEAAKLVTDRLKELKEQERRAAIAKVQRLREERRLKEAEQREQAKRLEEEQAVRQREEERVRQARLRKGWRGLLDRITGQRRKVEAENYSAAQQALQRDLEERRTLTNLQKAERKAVLRRAWNEKQSGQATLRELAKDIRALDAPVLPPPDKDPQKEQATHGKRQRAKGDRPRRRQRSRDEPSPGR